MKDFRLGDIVIRKGSSKSDDYYFIVIDTIDFSERGSTIRDMEYEIMQIIPVQRELAVDFMREMSLEIVASVGDKDHKLILNGVKREREKLGLYEEPYYLKVVESQKVSEDNKMTKFGAKEIKSILLDKKSEMRVDLLVKEMNTSLDILHNSIKEKRIEDQEIHLKKLGEIRKELMELEYFQLEKRRSGVSIRTK